MSADLHTLVSVIIFAVAYFVTRSVIKDCTRR
jgi:uncharacterized membrane protein